jgi:hypothetical protein
MGHCTYQYNASEVYQNTAPGGGVETCCGAPTFPAVDAPELVLVRHDDDTYTYEPTGRMLARDQDDPHCPAHDGTPEPELIPVPLAELEAARRRYAELAARFQVPAGELTAPVTLPDDIAAGELEPAQAGATDGNE